MCLAVALMLHTHRGVRATSKVAGYGAWSAAAVSGLWLVVALNTPPYRYDDLGGWLIASWGVLAAASGIAWLGILIARRRIAELLDEAPGVLARLTDTGDGAQ